MVSMRIIQPRMSSLKACPTHPLLSRLPARKGGRWFQNDFRIKVADHLSIYLCIEY